MVRFIFATLFLILNTSQLLGVTVDGGNTPLLPNTDSQPVQVLVTGTETVRGFNLRAQIGDGSGSEIEPLFEAVSFDDTLWSEFDTTTVGGVVEEAPQFAQASVVLSVSPTETVADGVLVNLLVDTTGIHERSEYPLLFSGTEIGEDTDFVLVGGNTLQPTFVEGILRIVPEPTSKVSLWYGAWFLLAWCRRRRRC